MVLALTLLAACQKGEQDKFQEIGQSLSLSIKQINKEPGITLTGFASNADERLFMVGINYDADQMSMDRLKQVVDVYLSNAASNVHTSNWKPLLEPYRLVFERIGDDKANFPILAEKDSGTTEIVWIHDNSLR
jgi:hypothetical protein